MKKILLSISTLLLAASMLAQTAPATNMALRVVVSDMAEPFPAAAKTQMENKLTQLIVKNGIVSTDWQNQFIITAVAVPQTKDILPGAPTQFAETMDFTFYIADAYNQLVFASANLTAKGVAESEAKSLINAIKNVNLNSSKLTAFVEEGKKKVINYYNTQAPVIFEKAMSLAAMQNYDEALFLLATIPAECNFFAEANAKGVEVFQMYQKHKCDLLLASARAAWAAEQNSIGAEKAGAFISQITPDMGCYQETMELYKEIKQKVLDDWKFEMKIYQDQVDLERERINAWREVGIEYGKHQQPTTNFARWLY